MLTANAPTLRLIDNVADVIVPRRDTWLRRCLTTTVTLSLAVFLACSTGWTQTTTEGQWPLPYRVEPQPTASETPPVEAAPWYSLSDVEDQELAQTQANPWIRFGSQWIDSAPPPVSEESSSEPTPSGSSSSIDARDFRSEPPPATNGKRQPTANITMQLQSDFAWFDQEPANRATVGEIPDGGFHRRSRMGVFGELYETVEYRLEYDFAGDARPRFLDNWIALTDIPIVRNVIVGHYFEPFSLERYSPNRFITFNERSLADTFAPARNMGMMIYGNALDEKLTFGVGAFRSNSDDYGDDVSFQSGYAGTAHATYLAWYRELNEYQLSLLHLGGSFSYRTPGDDPVRYASRPSIRMRQQGVAGVPVFVDTGNLDDVRDLYLLGLETAWVHGPLSVQAEWIMSQVNRRSYDSPLFHGGYVYGSWFLTGESRSYSRTSILGRFREGIFQRITPRSNVFDRSQRQGWTGLGAVELAVRWAYIDLNDAGVRGGYMEEMTYGVNWHLNKYTRISLNYVRPDLQDPEMGDSNANMYSLRFQFEF